MSALAFPVSPQHIHHNAFGAQAIETLQGSTDRYGGHSLSMSQSSPRKRASSGAQDIRRETLTKRESTTPNENSCENKDSSQNEDKKPKKRRKVNHACVYCRRSHMTCDQARPCSRCKKRDIGHLCHDEPRELKKMKSEGDVEGEEALEDFSPSQHRPARSSMSGHRPHLSGDGQMQPQMNPANAPFARQIGQDASRMRTSNGKLNSSQPFGSTHQLYNDWNAQNPMGLNDISNFPSYNMFNTSEVTNEYALLNNFLNDSLLDDNGLYTGDDPTTLFTDPSFLNTLGPLATSDNFFSAQTNQLAPATNATDGNAIPRPSSTVRVDGKAEEKYYMTAADPAGTEPPDERMNKLLKAKYDAGLLKPFNYVKGYAKLNTYMEKHMQPISRRKILQQLDAFRPMFRERMQSLTDVELVRVEMWFEMKLMEYDRVFASMAIPACCWRRTGEVFRGNREFAELIDVPVERLREGKLAIHDILGEGSIVMYWEKFGKIAFDPGQKAMLASCTLKKPDSMMPGEEIKCCFSFTIQRDEHLIPSIIIGNFLPVARGEG